MFQLVVKVTNLMSFPMNHREMTVSVPNSATANTCRAVSEQTAALDSFTFNLYQIRHNLNLSKALGEVGVDCLKGTMAMHV